MREHSITKIRELICEADAFVRRAIRSTMPWRNVFTQNESLEESSDAKLQSLLRRAKRNIGDEQLLAQLYHEAARVGKSVYLTVHKPYSGSGALKGMWKIIDVRSKVPDDSYFPMDVDGAPSDPEGRMGFHLEKISSTYSAWGHNKGEQWWFISGEFATLKPSVGIL